MKVFIDSDVIISSLISSSGASYLLLNTSKDTELYISSLLYKELKLVATRLNIPFSSLDTLVKKRFNIVDLFEQVSDLETNYQEYTTDKNDAHIIAGAYKAKVKFLISYNLKHFNREKIKRDLKITSMTPGTFLQYLRSQRHHN